MPTFSLNLSKPHFLTEQKIPNESSCIISKYKIFAYQDLFLLLNTFISSALWLRKKEKHGKTYSQETTKRYPIIVRDN